MLDAFSARASLHMRLHMKSGLSLYHSVLVSCDPAYSRVVKAHVITDFFEGVLVDDMEEDMEDMVDDMNDMCSMDRPISG